MEKKKLLWLLPIVYTILFLIPVILAYQQPDIVNDPDTVGILNILFPIVWIFGVAVLTIIAWIVNRKK